MLVEKRITLVEREGVKGSGLGLTIAKQIVSLHGGQIWLEDNPAGGSIFFVRLPNQPGVAPLAAA